MAQVTFTSAESQAIAELIPNSRIDAAVAAYFEAHPGEPPPIESPPVEPPPAESPPVEPPPPPTTVGLLAREDWHERADWAAVNDNLRWTGSSGRRPAIVAGVSRNGVTKRMMSFKYLANPTGAAAGDDEHWQEQKFRLAKQGVQPVGVSPFYMTMWFRVPPNFKMGSSVGHSENNKLFMIWPDQYSDAGEGATCGMEVRPEPDGANFYMKTSIGNHTKLSRDTDPARFITMPRDGGRWMELAVELIAESAPAAKDGSMRVWRRWDSDSAAWEQTHEWLNRRLTLPVGGEKGWAYGSLWGYANSTYAETTEFLVDEVAFGTTRESVGLPS